MCNKLSLSHMRKKTKISVTIPVRETPSSLLESLKGFLNQTVLPYEIVVVGASNDLAKIKNSINNKMKKRIKFIEFFGDKNEARNKGFLESSGEFVLFADHDMIPQVDLIESCIESIGKLDALIIPEYGLAGKSYLSKIFALEKKIVMDDMGAQTPRLIRKSLYKKNELPFNSNFGVLDEWGFYIGLKRRKPKIGRVKKHFTVKDELGFIERVQKSYRKGLWIKNLIGEDKVEGLRRTNPVKRGIVVYANNIKYIKKQPLVFVGLVLIKILDLAFFSIGLLFSLITNKNNNLDISEGRP